MRFRLNFPRGLLLFFVLWLVVVVMLPLGEVVRQSMCDRQGNFNGLQNYLAFFTHPNLRHALQNSIAISVAVMAITVPLAYLYAYSLARTAMPGKAFFRAIAMAPLYAPTMIFGIALVYIFGRQGVITTGFWGACPRLAWDIGIYGPTGIIIGEILLTFPAAIMIISAALANTDARLDEAAASLGAGRWRIFWTIFGSVRQGVCNAAFVVFTLCFTDFGVPKVIGGNTPILATEVYKQVIGQQNFGLGAVTSIFLLTPTAVAFVGERLFARQMLAHISGRAHLFVPLPNRWRDLLFCGICSLIAGAIIAAIAAAAMASLVRVWPYRLELGLWHYRFSDTAGGGYIAFLNSIRLAFWASLFGTALAFGGAYLTEKTRGWRWLQRLGYTLALLPLALPGLVIGIAYIFFFNAPTLDYGLRLANPFQHLYATPTLIVLSHITHFYTVAYLSALTALRQLDPEFEAAAESLGVPASVTFCRVTMSLCLPTIIEIAVYFFVNAMSTVSAVVFLAPAGYSLAAVAIVNMDDAGDTAPAAAMGILIILANIAARASGELAGYVLRHWQAWKRHYRHR